MSAKLEESPREAALRFARSALDAGYKAQALHTYRSADGSPSFYRIRLRNPATGEKWIRPMRPGPAGFELGEPAAPPSGKLLYRLADLAACPLARVWIVEGERCADALAEFGILATTSGGADSADAADWSTLRGRSVVIWPDNDPAGRGYGERVAGALAGIARDVRTIDAAALRLADKGDVVDWLQAHPEATREAVEALAGGGVVQSGSPKPYIVRRLADVVPRPVRWLWPGRIACGKVTIIAGNPGLGKSQLTASLAGIVSTGGLWPVDRTRSERGSVVLLNAEDAADDTIRPRLDAAGADVSRCYILDAMRVEGADGPERRMFSLREDAGRLRELLADIGDVRLVIVDPISAYLEGVDSHRNAEVRSLLAPLADVAEGSGAAVVLVSHLSKGGGSEALLRVNGSLAFVAAARAAYMVARDPDDADRRLFLPLKNNIGTDTTGFAFKIEGATVGVNETSRVVWDSEHATVPADEALASGTADDRSEAADAADWLASFLADGPKKQNDCVKAGQREGYSPKMLRTARNRIGATSRKVGFTGCWEWELPAKVPQDAQDAQAICVGTFGEKGTFANDARGTCAGCQHFKPDAVNPTAGLGACGLGHGGFYPNMAHRCEARAPIQIEGASCAG